MILSKKPDLQSSPETHSPLKNIILYKTRILVSSLAVSGCKIIVWVDKAPATATETESPEDSETAGEKPSMHPADNSSTSSNNPTGEMETNTDLTSDMGNTTISFPSETCGNNILDEGELCDYVDGLPQGLENSDCISETGIFKGILQCDPETCQYNTDLCTSLCGDGIISSGENCDDCNIEPGDGCNENCLLEGCGNGQVDLFEACDDGNQIEDDGCSTNCTLSTCGDGKLDRGEICDPNDDQNEPCQSNCTPPSSSCVIG